MKPWTIAVAATLWSAAAAFSLVARENPKVIGLDIQRKHVADPVARDRLRRRATVQQTLDNLETLYFANVSLGTPEQKLRLHIDTGSSDLWTNAKDSNLCSRKGVCVDSGVYNANASSSYSYVNSQFNISYVDGSGATGDYAKDTLVFGGQSIKGMQFGIGYSSSSPEGILGIGYPVNEVQVNRAGGKPYANLPQLLADNGNINTPSYSLWLNDLDANTGSILFGGVDTEKYHGSLSKLPIIQEQGVFAEFVINMTDMGMNGQQGSLFKNQNVPVLLDSGSSLIYLPETVVTNLYKKFNAQYDSSQGAAFVSCNVANDPTTLEFGFSGTTISVPMNELVVEAGYQRGQPICILGIGPAGDSTAVLGDTFLRSAYVVYDLANNQIALAQTNFNATKTSIKEIQTGTDGVPNASGAPNTSPSRAASSGFAMPARTPSPWLGAGAAMAGVGLLMGL